MSSETSSEQLTGLPYIRVYADEQGETHFVDEVMSAKEHRASENRMDAISENFQIESVTFRRIIEDDPVGYAHHAPARVFIVHLQGEAELEVSNGEKRRLGPGSIALMEDVTGNGHTVRSVPGSEPRVTMMLRLA